MIEIEIKAHLKNKEAVIEKIKEIGGIFEKPIFQDGMEYSPAENPTLEKYLETGFYLRIRTTNGKHVFGIKKNIPGQHELARIEHETQIENREEFENILKEMGYFPVLQIKKERIIVHYKQYEICLDEVEGLGSFIEIEKMSEQDPGNIRLELEELLFSFGVNPEDAVDEGYDTLMFKKLGRV